MPYFISYSVFIIVQLMVRYTGIKKTRAIGRLLPGDLVCAIGEAEGAPTSPKTLKGEMVRIQCEEGGEGASGLTTLACMCDTVARVCRRGCLAA